MYDENVPIVLRILNNVCIIVRKANFFLEFQKMCTLSFYITHQIQFAQEYVSVNSALKCPVMEKQKCSYCEYKSDRLNNIIRHEH